MMGIGEVIPCSNGRSNKLCGHENWKFYTVKSAFTIFRTFAECLTIFTGFTAPLNFEPRMAMFTDHCATYSPVYHNHHQPL